MRRNPCPVASDFGEDGIDGVVLEGADGPRGDGEDGDEEDGGGDGEDEEALAAGVPPR